MAKQVFYDPQRKRWTRLRLLFDLLGIVISALVLFFIVSVFFQKEVLPRTLLPELKRNLRTVRERERPKKTKASSPHRKTKASPS